MIEKTLLSDSSIILAAPTGSGKFQMWTRLNNFMWFFKLSGKTAVFEMCLVKLFKNRRGDENVKAGKKISRCSFQPALTFSSVYLAPSKFLVHQKMQVTSSLIPKHWEIKFWWIVINISGMGTKILSHRGPTQRSSHGRHKYITRRLSCDWHHPFYSRKGPNQYERKKNCMAIWNHFWYFKIPFAVGFHDEKMEEFFPNYWNDQTINGTALVYLDCTINWFDISRLMKSTR